MLTVMGEQYGIYAPNCRVLMYGGTLAGKTNAYNVLNISIPTTSSQNWKLSEYTSNGYYYAQVVKQ